MSEITKSVVQDHKLMNAYNLDSLIIILSYFSSVVHCLLIFKFALRELGFLLQDIAPVTRDALYLQHLNQSLAEALIIAFF